jgi:hypothetical protein
MPFRNFLFVSLVAAALPVWALESLDEEALSEASGQNGVTIGITPPALTTFSLVVHDTDGYSGFTNSGALVFGDPYNPALGRAKTSLAFAGEVVMNIDATGDGNGAVAGTPAILRANIAIPGVTINSGDIYVADTDPGGTLSGFQALSATATTPILSNMTITLGSTTLNFELGNENQGAMIKINTSMTGGLTVSGLALNDAGGAQTGGAFRTDLNIKDNGGANLTLASDVDFVPTGMRINLTQFGSAATGADMRMTGVKFGNAAAPSFGNITVLGLNMNNTVVRIGGH